MSPSFISSITLILSGLMQSSEKSTGRPSAVVRNSAATFSEYLRFFSPFGLPRWLISMHFPPFSVIAYIVGRLSMILLASVIFPFSSRGTLKSTLTRTLFPFIPFFCIRSSIVNLFMFVLFNDEEEEKY